ncbi:MAG TPA: hypothetical protein PKE57_08025, partial [Cellvibrionaceae bacterium]|nr:hypothetical protein [Cellvibrionaceae bacterium]
MALISDLAAAKALLGSRAVQAVTEAKVINAPCNALRIEEVDNMNFTPIKKSKKDQFSQTGHSLRYQLLLHPGAEKSPRFLQPCRIYTV